MSQARAAVLLSGCGYLDGAEVSEAVCALLTLSQLGVEAQCFALSEAQHHVVNHASGKEVAGESRTMLDEAARIARGDVLDMAQCQPSDFDMLVIPGGFGVAKNFSSLAEKGADATINPEFVRIAKGFHQQKKPIAAICIAPALLAAALGADAAPSVTVGDDEAMAEVIAAVGGTHHKCDTENVVIDAANLIISCPAYMRDAAPLWAVAEGIEKCVSHAAEFTGKLEDVA